MPNINGLGKKFVKSTFNKDSEYSLEYLSGLFDGEGCVVTVKTGPQSHQFFLKVSTTSKSIADTFQDKFGGVIGLKYKGKTKMRLQWAWSLTGMDRVYEFAEMMHKLCIVKRPQLEAVLMAGQTFGKLVSWSSGKKNKRGRGGHGGLRLAPEDAYIRELCFRKIRQCNQGVWDNLKVLGHEVNIYA